MTSFSNKSSFLFITLLLFAIYYNEIFYTNPTYSDSNQTSHEITFKITNITFIDRNLLKVEFELNQPRTVIISLDNSTNKKEIQLLENQSIVFIPVVENGWEKLKIIDKKTNQTFVFNNAEIPKNYISYENIAFSFFFISLIVFFSIIIITKAINYSKKNIIKITFPKSRSLNKKILVSENEIIQIIKNLQLKRFNCTFFTVTELKNEIEDYLAKKGVREPVSLFSTYLLVRKLMAKNIVTNFDNYYCLNDKNRNLEEEYVKRILIEKLMQKKIKFKLIDAKNFVNDENNNNFDLFLVKNHYVVVNEVLLNSLLRNKNTYFIFLCYDQKKCIELTRRYYHYTKDNSRLSFIPLSAL
ncbi:MAG: hypothetical protein QXJ06_00790 [Candidatus Aenigmatarchaeota archaeon]